MHCCHCLCCRGGLERVALEPPHQNLNEPSDGPRPLTRSATTNRTLDDPRRVSLRDRLIFVSSPISWLRLRRGRSLGVRSDAACCLTQAAPYCARAALPQG